MYEAACAAVVTDRANAESTMLQPIVRYFVMIVSPISGLRYNQKVIARSAQTERRGDAGPVRDLLSGKPHRPLFFFKTTQNAVGVWLTATTSVHDEVS